MRSVQITVIAVLAAVASGCASGRAARRAPEEPAPATVVPVNAQPVAAAPVQKPAAKRPALPVRKVAPGKQARAPLPVAGALKRFMAVRGVYARKRAVEMPDDVERTWRTMMEALEDTATEDIEPGREGELLSTLMRARMTLAIEFEMDEKRYKVVPPELKGLLRESLTGLDEQVAALRSLSTGGFALEENQDLNAVVTLRNPVQLVNVTSYFGRRRDPINRRTTRFHAGVDFGGGTGTLVMSAGPGVVAHADWQGGGGNHVIVVHPNGLRTHYSHLSRILVKQGQQVDTGAPLGLMGETGRATGPHLHFAVSRHGTFMDPLDALDVPMSRHGVAEPDS